MPALAADPTIRRQVMSAAREVLADDAGAPVGVIADRAGVSRATFYRHFGSRERLLQSVQLEPRPTARRRILAAAKDMLISRSLDELSMEELASRCGRVPRDPLPPRARQGGAACGADRGVLAVRGRPGDHRRASRRSAGRGPAARSAAPSWASPASAWDSCVPSSMRSRHGEVPAPKGWGPCLRRPSGCWRSTWPARWRRARSAPCTRSWRSRRWSARSSSTS